MPSDLRTRALFPKPPSLSDVSVNEESAGSWLSSGFVPRDRQLRRNKKSSPLYLNREQFINSKAMAHDREIAFYPRRFYLH